jgi:hypothetical protein
MKQWESGIPEVILEENGRALQKAMKTFQKYGSEIGDNNSIKLNNSIQFFIIYVLSQQL